MKMKSLRAFALVLTVAVVSCTQQHTKTAVDIAQATCVILRGLLPNTSEVKEICATAEELAPLVKHIITMRAYKAEHPGATNAEMDACMVATKKE